MGRADISAQRTAEILDAFEHCAIKYGVAGATLERLAEFSGFARPLIRHHVGNREQLLDQLINRFMQQSLINMQNLSNELPNMDRVNALIEALFDPHGYPAHAASMVRALLVEANGNEELGNRLESWIAGLKGFLWTELKRQYQEASHQDLESATTGIVALFLSLNSMAGLDGMTDFNEEIKQSVYRLISR